MNKKITNIIIINSIIIIKINNKNNYNIKI